jgi:sugar lactone lactonase YvrE
MSHRKESRRIIPPKHPDRTFDMTLTLKEGVTWGKLEDNIWTHGVTKVELMREYHTQSGRKLTFRVHTDYQETRWVERLREWILIQTQFIAKE